MILLNNYFSENFIEKFYNHVAEKVLDTRIINFSNMYPDAEDFIEYIYRNFKEIICGDFNTIVSKANEIYETFPILLEAFNSPLFFCSTDFSSLIKISEVASVNLAKNVSKLHVLRLKNQMIIEIEGVNAQLRSHQLEIYKESLLQATEAVNIRDISRKVMLLGNAGKADIDLFPSWIKEINTIFNYKFIESEIKKGVVRELDLDFCPMCNASEIDVIFDEYDNEHRPALDHFLPQSKHPLFSMSISNLIPTCHTCNSVFKDDKETLSPLHGNPYVSGVNDLDFFDFSSLVTSIMYSDSREMNLNIRHTGMIIDNNVKLFNLHGVYNRRTKKNKILGIISDINEYIENPERITLDNFIIKVIKYDSSKPLHMIEMGKLKKDLISFMLYT